MSFDYDQIEEMTKLKKQIQLLELSNSAMKHDRDRHKRLSASRLKKWRMARERATSLLNQNHKLQDKIRLLSIDLGTEAGVF